MPAEPERVGEREPYRPLHHSPVGVVQIARGIGRLEIDGGVKVDNIREIAEAGADTFVAGSAIFGAAKDSDANVYDTVVGAMRDELAKAS